MGQPTNRTTRSVLGQLLGVVFLFVGIQAASAEVVTRLPGNEPVVALTFDGCETRTPSFFDQKIVDYLVQEAIPATIFVNGKFARRNEEPLRTLSQNSFIEIENHTLNHPQHLENLNKQEITREVLGGEELIVQTTGRRPLFFRFPAGNNDQRSVKIVEDLGYRVVHWTFASGDPSRGATPEQLVRWVVAKTKPGAILIFHINGRGYGTGEALPHIVQQLRQKGYRFALLKDNLPLPLPSLWPKANTPTTD